jgi:hypothetical protein
MACPWLDFSVDFVILHKTVMDIRIVIMNEKPRYNKNNKALEATGGHEVAGSSPVAPICSGSQILTAHARFSW